MRHRRLHSSATCQHRVRPPVRRRFLGWSFIWWYVGTTPVSSLWKLATPSRCCVLSAMRGYLLVCLCDNGISVYPRLGVHTLLIPLALRLSFEGQSPLCDRCGDGSLHPQPLRSLSRLCLPPHHLCVEHIFCSSHELLPQHGRGL